MATRPRSETFREVWWEGVRAIGTVVEPSHERLCEIFDLFEAYGFVSREDVQDMLLGIGLNYTHVQATRLCRGATDLDLDEWLDRAAVAVAAQNRDNQAVVTAPRGAAANGAAAKAAVLATVAALAESSDEDHRHDDEREDEEASHTARSTEQRAQAQEAAPSTIPSASIMQTDWQSVPSCCTGVLHAFGFG